MIDNDSQGKLIIDTLPAIREKKVCCHPVITDYDYNGTQQGKYSEGMTS